MPMFRGKNELSHEVFLLLFEAHLRKVSQGFQCNRNCPQAALAFIAVAGSCELDNESSECHKILSIS
jgi:hypothetical protein